MAEIVRWNRMVEFRIKCRDVNLFLDHGRNNCHNRRATYSENHILL